MGVGDEDRMHWNCVVTDEGHLISGRECVEPALYLGRHCVASAVPILSPMSKVHDAATPTSLECLPYSLTRPSDLRAPSS